MKKIIFIGLLFLNLAVASQPLGHVLASKTAFLATNQFIKDTKSEKLGWLLRPVAGISSHLIMDRIIGEAGLGEYQLDIGILRTIIGYFLTDERERGEYLEYAFWGLLPDIVDKGFKKNIFHSHNMPTIFNLSRDQNELLEELFLASMIFKVEYKF